MADKNLAKKSINMTLLHGWTPHCAGPTLCLQIVLKFGRKIINLCTTVPGTASKQNNVNCHQNETEAIKQVQTKLNRAQLFTWTIDSGSCKSKFIMLISTDKDTHAHHLYNVQLYTYKLTFIHLYTHLCTHTNKHPIKHIK